MTTMMAMISKKVECYVINDYFVTRAEMFLCCKYQKSKLAHNNQPYVKRNGFDWYII